jgi:hypothetical protein
MNAGKLTIIVGLPGAGKSTEVKRMRPSITGLCIEDFHANAMQDSPAVKDSRHYRALIEALQGGHDCVAADIAFCDPKRRMNFEQAIIQDVPTVHMSCKYFQKDYAKCENNIRRRDQKNSEPALEKLREFFPKYVIPDGVTPIPVWQPTGDKAVPKIVALLDDTAGEMAQSPPSARKNPLLSPMNRTNKTLTC